MCLLKYTKKRFVFSNLLSHVIIFVKVALVVYVLCFRSVTLFPVRAPMLPRIRDALWDFSGSERSSALEGFRD